jgi:hypothetical protein
MDPYLERHWGDIHHTFITYARDQLQGRLPGDLRARVQERVFVETPERSHGMYPDIRVVERRRPQARGAAKTTGLAVAEPFRIRIYDEPVTQGFIEILDLGTGRRVVTVIEVLSPSNKVPGPGYDLFARKQKECHQAGVNRVEIDLLRAGRWVLSVAEDLVPESHRTTYRVCVFRAQSEAFGEIYRVPLRDKLPTIQVPLRDSDPDVPLNLQALIDQCYQNGGYGDDLDYEAEPVPPLDREDALWADAIVREKGKRSGKRSKKSARNNRKSRRRNS